jgi:predicted ATPase/DNA-binding CsgD family transcriptional regulator
MNGLQTETWIEPLSQREIEILKLIADGLSNHEIAQKLFLSNNTIKWYNKQIFAKLGVKSRTEATALARQLSLLEPAAILPGKGETRPTHNLPHHLTKFIGREQEIEWIKRLLTPTKRQINSEADTPARLVTLSGPGGVGKTRLAIRVGYELVEFFPHGVWQIELASLTDPELIPQAIVSVLDVREQPGQPIFDSLVAYLQPKSMLLLLENCEHIIHSCAQVSDTLLCACPELRILATSREALGIASEITWPVPLLTLPDMRQPLPAVGDLSQYEAVQLFVDRALAVQPSFKLTELNAAAVAQICQCLDGIPLAIELAAARVKVLKTSEIAARLDDRFALLNSSNRTALPRHQTLRAAIDWSYDLLSEPERILLRRLSVFAGGCTLEAAEQICSDRGEGAKVISSLVLDLMSHLVDKSLVNVDKQGGETRYRMLETIRQYAFGRLEESDEVEMVRKLHAEFFVALAKCFQSNMTSTEMKALFACFDTEQDNFRGAMSWARANGDAEIGLTIVCGLGEYWFWWAYRWQEGWNWISQFLALPLAQQFPQERANALRFAVSLLSNLGKRELAMRAAEEGTALFRELNDKSGLAWILADTGFAFLYKSDFIEATKLLDESIMLFREVDNLRGLAWALIWRATIAKERGHFEEAAGLYDESVKVSQSIGNDSMIGISYRLLGELAYFTGDNERANLLLKKSIKLLREYGDFESASLALVSLACIALAQGYLDLATAQYEESLEWFKQVQEKQGLCYILSNLGYVRHMQGDDRTASILLREALELQRQQEPKLPLIQSLERCAWVAADLHQLQRAARLFGAAEAARERIGTPFPPGEKPLYEHHLAQARTDLDRATFDEAWTEGGAMSLADAVAYALEGISE